MRSKIYQQKIPAVIFSSLLFLGGLSVPCHLKAGSCFDPAGNIVPVIKVSENTLAASAAILPGGKPAIFVNPKFIKVLSAPMATVVRLHECGHIALGHLYRGAITIVEEQQADCFGIRAALTTGEIKWEDLDKIRNDFATRLNGDWQHLPGTARAINIENCLGGGFDRMTWIHCKQEYDSSLSVIRQAKPNVESMKKVCKKTGATSNNCKEAKQLVQKLHTGIVAAISVLDQTCPFIVDPIFSKVFAEYSSAYVRLMGPMKGF